MNRITVCLIALFLIIGFCILPKINGDNFQIITINSDGSVSPSDAPLFTVDNVTYSLTNDITGSITVERNNITLNGASHNVTGDGNRAGVQLQYVDNVTIGNMTIGTVGPGIWLCSSSHCAISGNNITGAVSSGILIDQNSNNNTISSNSIANSTVGMYLESSPNNTVFGNNIETHANTGIALHWSPNNIISGNNVTSNYYGISCTYSDNIALIGNTVANNGLVGIHLVSTNCTICHNNFMNNTNQFFSEGLPNIWDNGFEGNYWSDYNGTDNNQDGIGDTSYTIDANNIDHYPLMGTFQSFNVTFKGPSPDYRIVGFEEVDIVSNSTISSVEYVVMVLAGHPYPSWEERSIILHPVSGGNGTVAFCRILVPNNLLNTSDSQIVRGQVIGNVSKLPCSNNTYTYLYFTYNNSATQYITILPEFPCLLILPLFFTTTLLGVIAYRKRMRKTKAQCTALS